LYFQEAIESGLGKLNLATGNGPFITQPSFWDSEGGGDNPATGAPLLDRNNGFLEPKEQGNQAILERAARYANSGFKIRQWCISRVDMYIYFKIFVPQLKDSV
jgi:hypothetical protein